MPAPAATMLRPDQTHDVPGILADLRAGDSSAFDRLLPIVYDDLRTLARKYLRRQNPGHTLEPTALVHEAFLRIADNTSPDFHNRVHFLAVAAVAMRQLLIDHARRNQAAKRGGAWQRVTLSALTTDNDRVVDILDLDEALRELASLDPQQARIVELRYFGGLTTKEAAEQVGVSTATIEREWRAARAWLAARLAQQAGATA